MTAAVAMVAMAGGVARAEEPVVETSASLGAGMFGAQPASTVDVGVGASGATGDTTYAVGVGGRARWLAVGGFRDEDWDEASEKARVVRYGLVRWAAPDESGEVS